MAKELLIIAHTPSDNTATLASAASDAAVNYASNDLHIRLLSPFDAIDMQRYLGLHG